MTTPNTPDAAPATEAPPEGDSLETDQPPEGESDPSANSEAARWRTKLRETEAERDALAERITGYQRRECEGVIADLLEVPADLWDIGGADLGDYYAEDGSVREDELRAAAGALMETRPGLAKGAARPTGRTWGQHSGPVPGQGHSWADVVSSR